MEAKKQSLTRRKLATSVRDLPINCVPVIKTFHQECREIRANLLPEQILNMDQTNLDLDLLIYYTYDKLDNKRVFAKKTDNHKNSLSITLTCSANGDKLPLLIILRRITSLRDFDVPDNVIILYNGNEINFDANLMKQTYIDRVLMPHKLRKDYRETHLFLDNAPCHKTFEVLNKFHENNIGISFIPRGMTSFLQPADVGIFRSFKASFYKRWIDWYNNEPKAFTKNHNLKSHGYVKAITLISDIWREFNTEVIKKTFYSTGIMSSNEHNFNSLLRYVLEKSCMPSMVLDNSCDSFIIEDQETYNQEESDFLYDGDDNKNGSIDINGINSNANIKSIYERCEESGKQIISCHNETESIQAAQAAQNNTTALKRSVFRKNNVKSYQTKRL